MTTDLHTLLGDRYNDVIEKATSTLLDHSTVLFHIDQHVVCGSCGAAYPNVDGYQAYLALSEHRVAQVLAAVLPDLLEAAQWTRSSRMTEGMGMTKENQPTRVCLHCGIPIVLMPGSSVWVHQPDGEQETYLYCRWQTATAPAVGMLVQMDQYGHLPVGTRAGTGEYLGEEVPIVKVSDSRDGWREEDGKISVPEWPRTITFLPEGWT